MKALAVAFLLLCVLAAPAFAFDTPEAQAIATQLGCDAKVTISTADNPNGYFLPKGQYPYMWEIIDVPQSLIAAWAPTAEARRAIFLHEVAHCLQHKNDERFRNPWAEWEADAQAMRWIEQFGGRPSDGPDFLLSVYRGEEDTHEGMNQPHGSMVGRIMFNYRELNRLFPTYQGA